METSPPDEVPVVQEAREEDLELLPELVTHLRDRRTELREQWANRITNAHLLSAMTDEEIFSMATSVYDSYVEVLETGSVEALQAYARDLSERTGHWYWSPSSAPVRSVWQQCSERIRR